MKQILDGAYWYNSVGNTHSKYWYVIREKRPSEREYINSIFLKKNWRNKIESFDMACFLPHFLLC